MPKVTPSGTERADQGPRPGLTTNTAGRPKWAGSCRRDNAPTTTPNSRAPGDHERTVPHAAFRAPHVRTTRTSVNHRPAHLLWGAPVRPRTPAELTVPGLGHVSSIATTDRDPMPPYKRVGQLPAAR
jgi:hypothetical protein